MTTITTVLDFKGLSCPIPVVKTAQAFKALPRGATVEVLATDPGSREDFAAWCQATGNALVEATVHDGVFRYVIRKE